MDVLRTWVGLNKVLMSSSEEEISKLFKLELQGKRRPTFLRRIYGRMSTLRERRERKEIAKATASHHRLRNRGNR